MKPAILLTTLLAGSFVHGARWTQKRRETRAANALRMADMESTEPMLQSRKDRPARSRPLNVVGKAPGAAAGAASKSASSPTNNTFTTYSQNWAGALLVNSGFTAVTGTIIVPSPTGANAAAQSAGAAWVGIDGGTCTSAILQTGIDWYVTGTTRTYDAWYEWYPAYAYDFTGISLKAGDSVRMTVLTYASTAGVAVIENLTTGQSVSQPMSVATSSALCETNAEWIVEDFNSCDATGKCGLVPFANFGGVTFTNSLATQAGKTVTPGTPGQGLMVLDMYQNSQVLTHCAVNGATVACTHV